jgi:hypothetical protein
MDRYEIGYEKWNLLFVVSIIVSSVSSKADISAVAQYVIYENRTYLAALLAYGISAAISIGFIFSLKEKKQSIDYLVAM